MSGAITRVPSAADTAAAESSIFRPGTNCWRVERAHRFRSVQDGAEYFALVREALLAARETVFILGWDILASVDLLPNGSADSAGVSGGEPDAPTRLDELLAFVARRRPQLRCYILIWDYAALYTLERDPWSRWKLGWRTPKHVRFGFDDRHPVGGSHHQKIVVVDDSLAFSGGIDLTGHRWDTSAHRIDEPARTSRGQPYEPYHDVQAMVSGPAAAALGGLARDRWRALGEEPLRPPGHSTRDLWPSNVPADLTDVNVAISRTMPASEAQAAVRECETLFRDSIEMARQSIYIESQYFTNDTLGQALATRLREPDGPEVIAVVPRECHGWLERNTMGAFRDSVFRDLMAADTHGRLRLVYPAASRASNVPTFIHSKIMVVDDRLVRIGSANFSRRSMGVDTECDVTVEAAGESRVRAGIRQIRDRLLAEHLGLPPDAVSRELARAGSLRALVDVRADADRTLVPIEVASETQMPTDALREAADPAEPVSLGSPVAELVPPVDTTYRARPLRVVIVPSVVLITVLVAAASAFVRNPELRSFQESLAAVPELPWAIWIGMAAFVAGTLALVPLEVMAVASGVLFGSLGGVVAFVGSMVAAAVGYAAGRAIGAAGVARWMSRRAYRSGRQLGGRGLLGVIVLRLSSVASAGSIHLLCGAGRVRFPVYLAGTVIGLIPAIAALSGLGALLRHTLLHPSVWNAAITIAAALLVLAVAAGVRTLLLLRQFAPSVSRHRGRVEFG